MIIIVKCEIIISFDFVNFRWIYRNNFIVDICGGKKCYMYVRCKNNKCVCSMGIYGLGEICKCM